MTAAPGLRPLRFPADVPSRVTSDYERAQSLVRPEGVAFALDGAPRVEGGLVRLTGHLDNPTEEQVTVVVFPVVNWANPFYLRVVPNEAVRFRPPDPNMPPPPPPAPPPPMELDLPPKSRVTFEASDDLSRYEWQGTPMIELEWSFQFWQPPKPGGRLTAQLPAVQR